MVSTESLEREAFANEAGYGAQRVGAFGIHYMNNTSGRFPAQDMRRIVFKESDGLQTWLVCISFSPFWERKMATQNYGTEQLHHLMLKNCQSRRHGECIYRQVRLEGSRDSF